MNPHGPNNYGVMGMIFRPVTAALVLVTYANICEHMVGKESLFWIYWWIELIELCSQTPTNTKFDSS